MKCTFVRTVALFAATLMPIGSSSANLLRQQETYSSLPTH